MGLRHILAVGVCACLTVVGGLRGDDARPQLGQGGPIELGALISTGDNYWLGEAMPIDSPAALEASFDMMRDLGIKHIYWRGMQDMTGIGDLLKLRPESARYYAALSWFEQVKKAVPEKMVVEAAHKRGMQIWGLGNLSDWGATGDTPGFADYPYFAESTLRIQHPEWIPRDKYGVLKQGGSIDFANPEARKTLVDLHMKYMKEAGYDGLSFLTYNENHSMRFNEEFGYTDASVAQFRKRYGIDPRVESFNRGASRMDWEAMLGENTTQYLRELKAELKKSNQKLSMCLQPFNIRKPQPWSTAPELMWTAGPMLMDLETWVQEGIVDDFLVFGNCDRGRQARAVKDVMWLSRGMPVTVGITTSGPDDPIWKQFDGKGLVAAVAFSEEEAYFPTSNIPAQPMSSLTSDRPILKMRALAQIILEGEKAPVADVIALADDPNLIVKRMALKALGKLKDPAGVPVLEKGLEDPENCVRFAAATGLVDNHGPQSVAKMLAAVEQRPIHPLIEIVGKGFHQFGPSIRAELAKAVQSSPSEGVRVAALWGLSPRVGEEDLPLLVKCLDDKCMWVRSLAVDAMGALRRSPACVEALIAATRRDDPVVCDRAAVSLADIFDARAPEVAKLRPQAVEALKVLYAKLGDGCQRADAEWGYRPVGDSLLRLGPDGRAVLQAYFEQTADKRLAEQAWKNLYIKRKPNDFCEVTERENEAAFRMRPSFLKTLEAERLSNGFDKAPLYRPETKGMAGDPGSKGGRWGGFAESGPAISSDVYHSSPNAAKIIRGGDPLSGSISEGPRPGNDYQVRVWVRRDSKESGINIAVNVYDGSWAPQMGVTVEPITGRLSLLDVSGGKPLDAGLRLSEGGWAELRLIADLRHNTYTAALAGPDGQEQRSEKSATMPAAGARQYEVLFTAASPKAGAATYVDDVRIIEYP